MNTNSTVASNIPLNGSGKIIVTSNSYNDSNTYNWPVSISNGSIDKTSVVAAVGGNFRVTEINYSNCNNAILTFNTTSRAGRNMLGIFDFKQNNWPYFTGTSNSNPAVTSAINGDGYIDLIGINYNDSARQYTNVTLNSGSIHFDGAPTMPFCSAQGGVQSATIGWHFTDAVNAILQFKGGTTNRQTEIIIVRQ